MLNREYVLKNFWDKLRLAKQMNAKDVRLTLKEMDDLGFCIYELLTEYYNKTIDKTKQNGEDETVEVKMDGGKF